MTTRRTTKRKKPVEAPPAKPVSAPRPAKVRQEPWSWVRGLTVSEKGEEVWTALFNFRWPSQQLEARATLRKLLEADDLPRYLADFEDFDLQAPDDGKADSPDSALEGSQTASEPLPAPAGQSKRQKTTQRPVEGEKKRRPRCREVYDATPAFRCIKRTRHEGAHRDLHGHEWDDDK